MPIAQSEITIEPLTAVHLAGVTRLYSDPIVCRQVLQMPYQSIDVWRKRLETSTDRCMHLIALHQDNIVGNISLEQYSRIRQNHVGTIGMGVASAWHGKGIGSRLMEAALGVADDWMNLRRIELTVFADNAAALSLYTKFGFVREGLLQDYAVRDGIYVDALTMARFRR